MVLAPFAVSQYDELRAGVGHHRCVDITGVRAFGAGMAILCTDSDLLGFLMNRVNQSVRWRDGNLDLHVALGRTIDGARFRKHGARAVHFPVSNDVGPFGHGYVLQIV